MGFKCVCVCVCEWMCVSEWMCVCVSMCVSVYLFVCCESEYQMLKVRVGYVAMVAKQQTNEPAILRHLPTLLLSDDLSSWGGV